MSVQIPASSRLKFGSFLVSDGVEFWDMLEIPSIAEQRDDIQYIVLDSDRIDKLAYDFYGDPSLWWVIARANDMDVLPTDLISGSSIRIPSPTFVRTSLFKQSKGR